MSTPGVSATNTIYEWDGRHRLTAIVRGAARSEFAYDWQGRLATVREKSGGATVSERRFVWCGLQMCEERDTNNVVVVRYFSTGEQRSGTNFYYFSDHLSSVRELTDSASVVRAEYAYSPYGLRRRLRGDLDSTRGFTHLFNHEPSSTLFALDRVYDPVSARWLSRDPMREKGGLNLYAYVRQNPIRRVDPLGDEDLVSYLDDNYEVSFEPEDLANGLAEGGADSGWTMTTLKMLAHGEDAEILEGFGTAADAVEVAVNFALLIWHPDKEHAKETVGSCISLGATILAPEVAIPARALHRVARLILPIPEAGERTPVQAAAIDAATRLGGPAGWILFGD